MKLENFEIHTHSTDWCHICGERVPCFDIFYSKNAEHRKKDRSECLRLCSGCIDHLRDAKNAVEAIREFEEKENLRG